MAPCDAAASGRTRIDSPPLAGGLGLTGSIAMWRLFS